jgi:pyrroline-5-carboxylate reductase
MDNYQIAIIGAGSMGGAILSGLIKAGTPAGNIRVSTKTDQSAKTLASKYRVSALSFEADPAVNTETASNADIVLLAVKPSQIIQTLTEIEPQLKSGCLVISVAAGITTSSMEDAIGQKAAVIRAMPNTPAIFGLGVTGLAKGQSASSAQLDIAKSLFETVGQVLVVEEEKINALSTISGSGPAYVFYFAEKLIAAAIKLGFTKQEAELMVKSTFLGSATLLAESAETPEKLRSQVSSPNGTTVQATARFDQADLEKVFTEATEAALARAIELGKS